MKLAPLYKVWSRRLVVQSKHPRLGNMEMQNGEMLNMMCVLIVY